ncbi:aminotransferase class I/II-fold pyridoxal phosphate-dependent enzyme [uncultured Enterococcus sp.]|uniref:aminotransferase class I/II-fold pyridoxal phosphate-dependent enzyme n=1 Tax=uncultured Enterococcus sp. TaxID=167972 RepID=UPI0025E1ADE5|nr:aminotransferase class I/II-fold pyridoxal phosphate-dependent enzyme [uncultured Enterococcus sp.]
MKEINQNQAPIVEALHQLQKRRVVPFDVPGHKRGKGSVELTQLFGEKAIAMDANSMKLLDNLSHPVSVIREAEELAARAFSAAHAFFMVNGTTQAVQNMIYATVKEGETIILPRNVHKSVINALIMCGGVPVYVETPLQKELEISTGMPLNLVKEAIDRHPEAKAILVNNPTYYGICSDLVQITEYAHQAGLKVLVDEAHGTHLYFGKNLPIAAMHAGCDMAAVSMHKSGGSLTQSSFLLCNDELDGEYVRQIINLTQTTSASYLLMASLDLSRQTLALKGEEIFQRVLDLAQYARDEINEIGDYYAYSTEVIDRNGIYDFDRTKLVIQTTGLGLTGSEVYDLLRDEYNIQIEFGDTANILAYISVGDRIVDIERLVGALLEIRRRFKKPKKDLLVFDIANTEVVMTPKQAFFAAKESLLLTDSIDQIAGEMVMCYPPGIPIVAPGEKITSQVIEHILYAKEKGCFLMGTEDPKLNTIRIVRK